MLAIDFINSNLSVCREVVPQSVKSNSLIKSVNSFKLSFEAFLNLEKGSVDIEGKSFKTELKLNILLFLIR